MGSDMREFFGDYFLKDENEMLDGCSHGMKQKIVIIAFR